MTSIKPKKRRVQKIDKPKKPPPFPAGSTSKGRRVKKIGKRGKIQGKFFGLPQAGSAPAKRKAAARTTGTTKKRPTRKR